MLGCDELFILIFRGRWMHYQSMHIIAEKTFIHSLFRVYTIPKCVFCNGILILPFTKFCPVKATLKIQNLHYKL